MLDGCQYAVLLDGWRSEDAGQVPICHVVGCNEPQLQVAYAATCPRPTLKAWCPWHTQKLGVAKAVSANCKSFRGSVH